MKLLFDRTLPGSNGALSSGNVNYLFDGPIVCRFLDIYLRSEPEP